MRRQLLGALTLSALVLGQTAGAVPHMGLPETEFAFGIVPQNTKITHRFYLKSDGTDTLKIEKVIPGCGCTQTPLEKNAVAVGDSTFVEIIFSTGSYTGNVLKTPSVQTNASAVTQALKFTANITTAPDSTFPITVIPYKLDLSQFTEKERGEMSFTLANRSEKALHPTMVSFPTDYFTVTLPKVVESGKSAIASIKLTPKAIADEFEKSLTFQVDDSAKTRFTVPIKRQVRPTATTPQTPAVTNH
jgi:hypothetical protein